jgi:hypothetical protein
VKEIVHFHYFFKRLFSGKKCIFSLRPEIYASHVFSNCLKQEIAKNTISDETQTTTTAKLKQTRNDDLTQFQVQAFTGLTYLCISLPELLYLGSHAQPWTT